MQTALNYKRTAQWGTFYTAFEIWTSQISWNKITGALPLPYCWLESSPQYDIKIPKLLSACVSFSSHFNVQKREVECVNILRNFNNDISCAFLSSFSLYCIHVIISLYSSGGHVFFFRKNATLGSLNYFTAGDPHLVKINTGWELATANFNFYWFTCFSVT